MNRTVSWLGLLMGFGLLSGCWSTVLVDGQKVHEESWSKAQTEVLRRAAFEMPCDATKIQTTLIETNTSNIPPLPSSVGATGCGQRLTYKKIYGSGWALNARTRL